VLTLEPSPLGDQYLPKGMGAKSADLVPFGINRCNSCGQFQTITATDPDHYRRCLTRPAAINSALSVSYRESVPKLIELTGLSTPDLVLEVGSNDGLFSSFFREKGFRCLGVDPALNLTASAEDLGVPTLAEFFDSKLAEKIVAEHGHAKVIVANFVVANVDDLDDFIDGVEKVLAPEGVFVIETNYVFDIVSKLLIETLVHEHLSYFSVVSLSDYLVRHGLEMFDVVRVPSKAGSLRCYIQRKGSKFSIQPNVYSMRDLEISSGLFRNHAWNEFSRTLADTRKLIIDFCEQRLVNGIVGYGTSDGATTLIYQLGIGSCLKALIDDDPYRQNLESPGFGIPTVSREDIFTDPPAAGTCLILAPQYFKQIFDKNLKARELGVTFARVWPQLEELTNSYSLDERF
jgi:2-polyprenyl-3-methyl-5-hydroxy-6-metoxy-1,4-benzoquinol methylase